MSDSPTPALKVERLPIARVWPSPRARARNDENVQSLKRSIAEIGLKSPITVRRCERDRDGGREEGFEIVAGHHRYDAALRLDWQEIECIVTDDDDLHRELWAIDENLCRTELGVAAEANAVARRKQIYEGLNPETKAGQAQAIGMNRKLGHNVGGNLTPTFVKDTAQRRGKSESHIERAARRGLTVAPDVLDAVNGTSMDKAVELDALTKLRHEEQRRAVELVKAGGAATLREAASTLIGLTDKTEKKPPAAPAIRFEELNDDDKEHLQRLDEAWNNAPGRARRYFVEGRVARWAGVGRRRAHGRDALRASDASGG